MSAEKLGLWHTTDAYSLRNMVTRGELAGAYDPGQSGKRVSYFSIGRPILKNASKMKIVVRAPAIIMAAGALHARGRRNATELQVEGDIPFSSPLVRGLILPSALKDAHWLSSFLERSGRDIRIRWFDLSPLALPTDYEASIAKEYRALLEEHGLREYYEEDLSEVIFLRRAFNKELIQGIARNPKLLAEVEWRELEHLMAEVFERLGFGVKLTRPGRDGGKDIELTCHSGEQIYYVELKHWTSGKRVGRRPVHEFLNLIIKERVSGGLYLSTSGYASSAITSLSSIERTRLRLGAEAKVVSLCQTCVRSCDGIWTPEPMQVLYSDTF